MSASAPATLCFVSSSGRGIISIVNFSASCAFGPRRDIIGRCGRKVFRGLMINCRFGILQNLIEQ